MAGMNISEVKLSRFGAKELADEPHPIFQLVSADVMGVQPNIRVRICLSDGMERRDFALTKEASTRYTELPRKPVTGDNIRIKAWTTANNTNSIEDLEVVGKAVPEKTAQKFGSANKENFSKGGIFTPITALTSFTKDFKLLARVVSITDVKTFNGKNGEGKVFNIIVMDNSSDQISIKFFNDAVDEHYYKLQKGNCYVFSKGQVRLADKRYTPIDAEYELSFFKNSIIEPYEDTGEIGSQAYAVSLIGDLTFERTNEYVDLCAVITELGEAQGLTSKAGVELVKRDIFIADPSDCSIKLTLWNEAADITACVGDIIMAKRVRVNDYQETLSVVYDRLHSEIQFEPKITPLESVQQLKEWQSMKGTLQGLKQLTITPNKPRADAVFTTAEELNDEYNIETGYKDETVFTLFARTQQFLINENSAYPSCSNQGTCKKKVREENGLYFCVSCNTSSNTCVWRYMLHTKFSGAAGCFWATLFDDQASKLFETSAEAFKQMPYEDQKALSQEKELQEFKMILRAKMEEYNGEIKPRFTVLAMIPFDDSDLLSKMVSDIEAAS